MSTADTVLYAVLTGDIIDSSKVQGEEKNELNNVLRAAFDDIHSREESGPLPSFDIFRGDSFQCVLPDPAASLWAVLVIRSLLLSSKPADSEGDWDARLAIGLGTIDYLPENISEGDGEAYRRSGPVLDAMKGDHKTVLKTPWPGVDAEFEVSFALLDAVVSKWTPPQAEIVHFLLQDNAPKVIAEELDISQAAVHYRVKGANWFAVEALLSRFHEVIRSNLESISPRTNE